MDMENKILLKRLYIKRLNSKDRAIRKNGSKTCNLYKNRLVSTN